MKRYFRNSKLPNNTSRRINLLGVIFLVTILSGILLFYTNEKHQTHVLKSFCGDFGFNGKSLVLMKDSTFRFIYYGCSQTNGSLSGNWSMNNQIITFWSESPDDFLDTHYQWINNELIPLNDSLEEKFVDCEEYASLGL